MITGIALRRPDKTGHSFPDIGVMQITDGGQGGEDCLKAELRTGTLNLNSEGGGYSDFKEQPAGPNTWPPTTAGEMLNAEC